MSDSDEYVSHLLELEADFPEGTFLIEISGDRQSVKETVVGSLMYGKFYPDIVYDIEKRAENRDVELDFWMGESVVERREREALNEDLREQYADDVRDKTHVEETEGYDEALPDGGSEQLESSTASLGTIAVVIATGVLGQLFFIGLVTGWNFIAMGNAFVAILCALWIGAQIS